MKLFYTEIFQIYGIYVYSCIWVVRTLAILAILYIDLPITTTIAGKWLKSIIFQDDIKFITANG